MQCYDVIVALTSIKTRFLIAQPMKPLNGQFVYQRHFTKHHFVTVFQSVQNSSFLYVQCDIINDYIHDDSD